MKSNREYFDDAVEQTEDQTEKVEASPDQATIEDAVLDETNQWMDRFLRVSAEFENFKKRTSMEQIQWIQRSQQKIIIDVLSIVDNFERALQQKNETNESLFVGIEMIYKSCLALLKKYNVEEIPTSGTFDPEKHEAIMQVDSADHASGEIVLVVQKGYMMNNQIIRPAQVSVAQ
jgi:molecular chaperone GrpE